MTAAHVGETREDQEREGGTASTADQSAWPGRSLQLWRDRSQTPTVVTVPQGGVGWEPLPRRGGLPSHHNPTCPRPRTLRAAPRHHWWGGGKKGWQGGEGGGGVGVHVWGGGGGRGLAWRWPWPWPWAGGKGGPMTSGTGEACWWWWRWWCGYMPAWGGGPYTSPPPSRTTEPHNAWVGLACHATRSLTLTHSFGPCHYGCKLLHFVPAEDTVSFKLNNGWQSILLCPLSLIMGDNRFCCVL